MELPRALQDLADEMDIDLEKAVQYAGVAAYAVSWLYRRNPWVLAAMGAFAVGAAAWWLASAIHEEHKQKVPVLAHEGTSRDDLRPAP